MILVFVRFLCLYDKAQTAVVYYMENMNFL